MHPGPQSPRCGAVVGGSLCETAQLIKLGKLLIQGREVVGLVSRLATKRGRGWKRRLRRRSRDYFICRWCTYESLVLRAPAMLPLTTRARSTT